METRSILRFFGLIGACFMLFCVGFAPAGADTVLEPQGPSSAPSHCCECPDTAAACYELMSLVACPAGIAVGQTITVPSNGDTDLVSFGIGVYSTLVGVSVGMVAEVYAWDGSQPTGSPLYTSPLTPLADYGSNAQEVLPIFETGGLQLQAGGQYIIAAST